MANGRNEQRQGVEWLEQAGYGRLRVLGRRVSELVWRKRAYLYEEIEHGLQNIGDMAKIMVENEVVISFPARDEKYYEFVCVLG